MNTTTLLIIGFIVQAMGFISLWKAQELIFKHIPDIKLQRIYKTALCIGAVLIFIPEIWGLI